MFRDTINKQFNLKCVRASLFPFPSYLTPLQCPHRHARTVRVRACPLFSLRFVLTSSDSPHWRCVVMPGSPRLSLSLSLSKKKKKKKVTTPHGGSHDEARSIYVAARRAPTWECSGAREQRIEYSPFVDLVHFWCPACLMKSCRVGMIICSCNSVTPSM